MPVVKEKKTKSKRRNRKREISQKVIQNVIVKVGEERRAKKARRKQRRLNRADLEAIQEQQINAKVAPMVVYQTAAPFQAPQQIGLSFQQDASRIQSREDPRFLEVEPQPLEFIDKPTKKEQLSQFIDPIAETMDKGEQVASKIYTQQLFPQKKVEGNYAFGQLDQRDTSTINSSENNLARPAPKIKSLAEWVNDNGREPKYAAEPVAKMETIYATVTPSEVEGATMEYAESLKKSEEKPQKSDAGVFKAPRSKREDIQNRYRDELKSLLLQEGITESAATDYSNVPTTSKQFKDAIKLQKKRLKELNPKSKKGKK